MNKLHKFSKINYMIIYICGAVATFSNTPFSILPLIFTIGFGIYLINFMPSLFNTFIAGWLLGLGWFSFGLYWIGSAFIIADTYPTFIMPIAIILLPSLLALFWGLACVCAKLFCRNSKFLMIYIIIFLSLFEYLRAKIFTGFPWLMPSMVMSSNEYLIQIFSFIGSFSTNLVTLTISVLPFILFSNFKGKYFLFSFLFIPILFLICCAALRYNNKNILKIKDHFITIVQPNIEQKNKWNLIKRDQHLKKLITLSNKNELKLNNKIRLIIWPETSFEGSIPNEMKLLSSISKQVIKNSKTFLVVGLLRTEENKIFNSLVFLDFEGKILHKYDKIHLVPFGEYIPFRRYLRIISDFLPQKDFNSGKFFSNPSIDSFGGILTLICYEILFSEQIFNRISNNTNLLINITNDAWFGKTIGPHQHLALAKIKAVEFGLPLARVANTGISVYVSPYGETISKIPLYKEGVKTYNSISALDFTFYKFFGEYIFIISIFILLTINRIYNFNYKENLSNEK